MKDLEGRLASDLGLSRSQVAQTAALFDNDHTLPFIARYRKELTGGLDEEVLARFREELAALRKLDDRQKTVLKTIEEQGKLNPELEQAIEAAESLQQVEDLYLPYKPRRRTRAQAARERGLEPLAEWILDQILFEVSLEEAAEPFLYEEVPTIEDAYQGAQDIIAEVVSENAEARAALRQLTWDYARLESEQSKKDNDPKKTFETYYEFQRALRLLKPHQVLALNRGEAEKALRVNMAADADLMIRRLKEIYRPDPRSPLAPHLEQAVADSYQRLLGPALEREVRRDLTEWAGEHAINVFATNLRNLLFAPPLKSMTVLGIDPGFRTGSKIAVVDPTGRVMDVATIYPHPPQRERSQSLDALRDLVARYGVELIAIGNGTASRETEELVAELLSKGVKARYLMVSEAGASVYSASPLARAELPDLDVSLRGAVSIARRTQDPLAELVKIDPRSIGVGMYQHDVDQSALDDALIWVIESVVNAVGVDLNTASPALLQYVSGLGPELASRIVDRRDRYGPFQSRQELMDVRGMGPRTYEQAAGFLRISDGENLLDNTGVHPESYEAVEKLLQHLDLTIADANLPSKLGEAQAGQNLSQLADTLGIGLPTLNDIFLELQRPGRDPRDDVPAPILRDDLLHIEDLKPGMQLNGTVRNVVDFGAFVDIGVKEDGLVHISKMAHQRIESPYDVVGVGDVIQVTIVDVDTDRGRIGLSMIG